METKMEENMEEENLEGIENTENNGSTDNLGNPSKVLSRDAQIVRASVVGIGTNILLSAFKLVVGLVCNSIAIILDAMNNLSDALSSVITIVGMKLAGLPADKKHPYGHGRIEYMSSVLIAGIILFAGVSFLFTSAKKIIEPDAATYSVSSLVIICVAIVAKLLLGGYTKKVGQRVNSDSLMASGADATFDAVISAGTLVAAAVNMLWGVALEGIIGVIISVVIIKAGIEMLADTLSSILGQRVDSALSKEIKGFIRSFDGVLGAYDLILHNYGPEKMIGSVNIEVYDYVTAKEIFHLSKHIQRAVAEKYGINVAIGIYSKNTDDEKISTTETSVRKLVMAHQYVMAMHAFYIDFDEKTMDFDIVVDFEAPDAMKIRQDIINELTTLYEAYSYGINIDRDYSD